MRREGATGPITNYLKKINPGGEDEKMADNTPPVNKKRKLRDDDEFKKEEE